MNIVQLLMNQLSGGGFADKLAGLLGIGQDKARSATGAAIPALLAGLSQLSSTPDGARKLNSAIDEIDDAEDPASLAARGASDAASPGGGMLSSLLGGTMFSGLGSALSKFTGMGGGTITTMLGALAPLVLGFLKGQKRSMGLDASGLAGLLSSQKNNIAAAMPSGLGSMLGSIPGLSSFADAGRSAVGAVSDAASSAYDRGREAVSDTYDRTRDLGRGAYDRAAVAATRERAGTPVWMWALPLALLAGLAAWMLTRPSRSPETTAINTPPPMTPVPEATPAPVTPAPVTPAPVTPAPAPTRDLSDAAQQAGSAVAPVAGDIATRFTDITRKLSETFTSITDPASAEAALPKLRDASKALDSLSGLTSSLPADTRSQLVSLADASRSTLKTAADKAMAIPGVGDKIRPVVEELIKKIDALAGR
jgi:hypothetical protein